VSDKDIVLAVHPTGLIGNEEGRFFVYISAAVDEYCPTCGAPRKRILKPEACPHIGTRAWANEAAAWKDAAETLEKAGKV
jgi:hypothetical protein